MPKVLSNSAQSTVPIYTYITRSINKNLPKTKRNNLFLYRDLSLEETSHAEVQVAKSPAMLLLLAAAAAAASSCLFETPPPLNKCDGDLFTGNYLSY